MKNVGHPRPTAYLMAPYVASSSVHQGEKTSCNVEGEKTGQMGRICIHDCSQRAPGVRGYQKTPIFEIQLIPYLIPFLWP